MKDKVGLKVMNYSFTEKLGQG